LAAAGPGQRGGVGEAVDRRGDRDRRAGARLDHGELVAGLDGAQHEAVLVDHGGAGRGGGGAGGGLARLGGAGGEGGRGGGGDGGAGLGGEREGGLDRAVAAADYRDAPAGVLGGVGELVDDVGQLGAGDGEAAGRAATADREDDAVGGGGAGGGLDVEAG